MRRTTNISHRPTASRGRWRRLNLFQFKSLPPRLRHPRRWLFCKGSTSPEELGKIGYRDWPRPLLPSGSPKTRYALFSKKILDSSFDTADLSGINMATIGAKLPGFLNQMSGNQIYLVIKNTKHFRIPANQNIPAQILRSNAVEEMLARNMPITRYASLDLLAKRKSSLRPGGERRFFGGLFSAA